MASPDAQELGIKAGFTTWPHDRREERMQLLEVLQQALKQALVLEAWFLELRRNYLCLLGHRQWRRVGPRIEHEVATVQHSADTAFRHGASFDAKLCLHCLHVI